MPNTFVIILMTVWHNFDSIFNSLMTFCQQFVEFCCDNWGRTNKSVNSSMRQMDAFAKESYDSNFAISQCVTYIRQIYFKFSSKFCHNLLKNLQIIVEVVKRFNVLEQPKKVYVVKIAQKIVVVNAICTNNSLFFTINSIKTTFRQLMIQMITFL